jgi:DNA-binding transcriptional LysR family regulator
LTQSGRTLLRASWELLDAFEKISRSLRHDTGPRLRIAIQGLDQRVAERRQVRAATLALRAIHPGTVIEFSLLGYEEPADALRSGRVDLALTAVPLPDRDLVSTRLWELDRIGVLPARHALARRAEVDAEEFAAYPMLFVAGLPTAFMSLWSLGDTRPLAGAQLMEITPRTAGDVYRSIASTGGLLALHPEAARNRPHELRTVTLHGTTPTWYYMAQRRKADNARADAYLRLLRNNFGRMGGSAGSRQGVHGCAAEPG